MKFTEQTPTEPGDYYWKPDATTPWVVVSLDTWFDWKESATQRGGYWSPRLEPVKPKCQWVEDDGGPWQTGCGHAFEFTTDGPKENLAKFCQYCGGEIEVQP